MKRTAFVCLILVAMLALPSRVAADGFVFPSIDGGEIVLDDWRGRPVLVVNTASLCAFTPQYNGLQALYDRYQDEGLVVLAVPSDSFRQELDDEEQVKDFCELNYDLDLPMTEIVAVRGPSAHPFYRWLEEQGMEPAWNFHKVLLGPDGRVIDAWGATMRPSAAPLSRAIETALGD
jgi:glutathione peroxidase